MYSSNSFEERLSENCKLIFPAVSGELTKEGKEFLAKLCQSDNLDIRYGYMEHICHYFFFSDH
jgi:hypothetical protein